MQQKRIKFDCRGFTLAELLLASALLAFVISGLLALFINAMMLDESNRNLSVAAGHAQYAMEEVKNTNFGSIAGTFNGICWNAAAINGRGLSALTNETICFTVAGTTALSVTATDSWQDRGRRNRNIALQTIIVEP